MPEDDHIKLEKSWLAKVVWALSLSLGGLIVSGGGWYWSWERSQVTNSDLEERLNRYDHGTEEPLEEKTPAFPDGLRKTLKSVQSDVMVTQTDMKTMHTDCKEQQRLTIYQYEWLVRMTAASSEPVAARRAETGRRAVLKFRQARAEGSSPDEAARMALEVNPYGLR